ncbi:hypothetical protein [Microbacterium sp. JAI119]|uniref:hypothetical protein n=1 Tax=Microbacterium sp. JAI119 TaxID=2723062 RepID=UPI0015CD48B2|nr:hypothetical protein [Microbacterium sp. JAI119]NYF29233.1 vacuolar-type H+-ATPase subunit H [Microbacterium sp. JAI119]
MALSIDIAANTRAAQRDVKDLSKALDDTSEALDDLARDSGRSGDKVEASFRDMVRAAGKADDAVKNIGETSRRSFDDAKEGAEEFRDEANSTAREAAASFDGSAESIADMFQEVAANAFAGFGPAGAAAGLLAAAGIGLGVAGFEAMNEAEQESRERAAEWADAYVEAGGRILNASQLVERARAIITDEEQYAAAQRNAKDWGVTESVALLAMAGDTNALAEARESLAQKETTVAAALEKTGGDIRGLSHDMRTMREDVSVGGESLSALTGEMNAGAEQADVYSTSLRLLADRTEGATRTVDEFGDTVVTLPDGKQIYIDAETGRATENVDAIERKIYGIPDGNSTVRVGVDTSEWDRAARRISGTVLKVGTKVLTPDGWNR